MATFMGTAADETIVPTFVSATVSRTPAGAFPSDADDALDGGSGNDTLEGSGGNDTLDGGADRDTVRYHSALAGVTVSLALAGAQDTNGAGSDTLTSIENLDGSAFDDNLTGNSTANVMLGLAGDDWLDGGAGDDTLHGMDGDDKLFGGDGRDTLFGGWGANSLDGGAGNDDLTASGRGDTLFGGAGDDVLSTYSPSGGSAILDGGAGNDTLRGAFGFSATASYGSATSGVKVSLAVHAPQDTGGSGTDTLIDIASLTGSAFDDALIGDSNRNFLRGDSGDDTLDGGPGGNGDTLDGGAGNDVATYGSTKSGVTVNLAIVGLQATGGGGSDTLVSIENLTGSTFDDTLIGNDGSNVLGGGAGNDRLEGSSGSDTLIGGDGQDRLNGGDGNDSLDGGDGQDRLDGGDGNDSLDGGNGNDTASYDLAQGGVTVNLVLSGPQNTGGGGTDTLINIENLTGSDFADTLTGAAYNNDLRGGDGNDTLNGGGGDDFLEGGNGNDTASYDSAQGGVTVSLTTSNPQNTGGSGTDTLINIENLTGSDFGDTLTARANSNNSLSGRDGDDTLDGGGGYDILDGGTGNDTASYISARSGVRVNLTIEGWQETNRIYSTDKLLDIENLTGSAFADKLIGNGGANALIGGAGNDTLDGGDGNDALDGDAGNDTASYESATAGVRASLAIAGPQSTGGGGTDILIGLENLTGSAFADVLAGDAGNNSLDGGAGRDVASYAAAMAGVTVNLAITGPQDTGGDGIDTLKNFESLAGSAFDDELTGNSYINTMSGGGGDDALIGGGGNDTLDGGVGMDAMFGGTHDDAYYVDNGADQVFETIGHGIDAVYTSANWTMTAGQEIEILRANAGAAGLRLVGNELNNTIYGGNFNDTLIGGAGLDKIHGGDGDDRFILSIGDLAADEIYDGGAGNDILDGSQVSGLANLSAARIGAIEKIEGFDAGVAMKGAQLTAFDQIDTGTVRLTTAGAVDVTASTLLTGTIDLDDDRPTYFTFDANIGHAVDGGSIGDRIVALGAAGATLSGGGGRDKLYGGSGDDILVGGLGCTSLHGGSGADRFVFLAASDSLVGNQRDVIYDFEQGTDTIDLSPMGTFHLLSQQGAVFDGVPDELRYFFNDKGTTTLIQGDINGDMQADFMIQLQGTVNLLQSDFL